MQSLLWVWGFLHAPGLREWLDEEEPQGSHALVDGVIGQLPLAEEIHDVLADPFGAELIGRTFEIACKVLNGAEVGARGTRRVMQLRRSSARRFASIRTSVEVPR